jgi:hypothetical protein
MSIASFFFLLSKIGAVSHGRKEVPLTAVAGKVSSFLVVDPLRILLALSPFSLILPRLFTSTP